MIPRGRVAALTTIFVIGWTAGLAGPSPSPSDSALQGALRLLHDGRFDEADDEVRALCAASPDDPAVAFAHAFVTWWRLLYDDESARLERTFEERIIRAAEAGEAALTRRDRPDDRVWAGYSRLLLAQLRASQKRTMAAAREAREAHRLLTEASQRMPSSSEALFGLGTYNYYADRVSALVKGLRFLLGLRAGDRQKGLDQLERAAIGSAFFGLESRLLRATIFASRHERDYLAALVETGQALALAPDAVTALDASARLDLVLGRADLAAARLDRALLRTRSAPRTDRSVDAALRLERARVEFVRLRPDHASEQLRSLRNGTEALPGRVDRDSARLLAVSEWLIGASQSAGAPSRGTPPLPDVWSRLSRASDLEASVGLQASLIDFRAAAREFPGDPNALLFLGRALLRAGHAAEALSALTAADRPGTLPEPWVGPCRLLSGEAADLSGDRRRARELYLKASKSPPFIEHPATVLLRQVPYSPAR